MSHYDADVRIGSGVRGPGSGNVQKSQTLRTNSEINAAKRQGNVTTEKKYSTGNQNKDAGGQRLTKVDREDDIVKTVTIGREIGELIGKMRKKDNNAYLEGRASDMTQKELAQACSVLPQVISEFEKGDKKRSDPDFNKTIGSIERVLNVKLQGKKDSIGQPKFPIRAK